jgi:hypothetical protein
MNKSPLRNLVIKQPWTPAEIKKGETIWLSDTAGAAFSSPSNCAPNLGTGWLPFGPVPGSTPGGLPAKSITGLMKPALASYTSSCGISIRLHKEPAESEIDRVTNVRIQVVNIKAINEFVAMQQQR